MSLSKKLALATMPKPASVSLNRSSGSEAVSSRPCSEPPLPLNGAVKLPVFCTTVPGGRVPTWSVKSMPSRVW